jgi:hypothetical protein
MQEWATPLGFETREDATDILVFYICPLCFDRAQTEPAYAEKIDAVGRQWHAMNGTLARFQIDNADVL